MNQRRLRPELPSGTIIGGDFEVIERLAGGGMGEVYLAKQRGTGAIRAVKRLHAHLLKDDVSRTRFEREATVVARIESMHVAQVIAAGIDEARSEPFIAMEYLRGETVSALVARGPLDRALAVRVMTGVGHALAAAHRVGVVHRDIKPDNIMLAESQLAGVDSIVKVLDFGIALIAKGANSQRITGELSVGTPPYMAPEQFSDPDRIGPPTDVWAMGLLLFEMLTGRGFWNSSAKTGGTIATLIQEIVDELIPPSALRAAQKGATLDPLFSSWIDQCLRREPSQRFLDAQQAVDALTQLVRVEAPSSATRTNSPSREPSPSGTGSIDTVHSVPTVNASASRVAVNESVSSAPPSSRRSMLVVGALLGVALSTGGAIALRRDRRSPDSRDQRPITNGVSGTLSAVEDSATYGQIVQRSSVEPPGDSGVAALPATSEARPGGSTRAAVVARRTATATAAAPNAPPMSVRERDARIDALLARVLRGSGCFRARDPELLHTRVQIRVSPDGRVLYLTTSHSSDCVREIDISSLSAPRWPVRYELSLPLFAILR